MAHGRRTILRFHEDPGHDYLRLKTKVRLLHNHVFYAVSTYEFFFTIELRSSILHPPSTSSLQPSSPSRQSQITRSQIHRSQETIFFYGRTNHSRGGGEATGGRVRPDSSTATQEQAAAEQQPASSGEANPDTMSGLEQSGSWAA